MRKNENNEENFYQRCPVCGQIEHIYKKIYYDTDFKLYENNLFHICGNPKCYMFVELKTNQPITNLNEEFEWVKVFPQII